MVELSMETAQLQTAKTISETGTTDDAKAEAATVFVLLVCFRQRSLRNPLQGASRAAQTRST